MDPAYYRRLRNQREKVFNGLYLIHMISAYRGYCLITDHGLDSHILFARFSDIRFVDVRHGIPSKGFDSHEFGSMRGHAAVFVSSPLMKDIYLSRYGLNKDQVAVN
jgi:CDP-glycerol glycerophosphotransferase